MARFSINGTIYKRVDGRENKGNANERQRFHKNIFIYVMILKGDLKRLPRKLQNIFSDTACCEQARWEEYCPLLEPIRLQDLQNTACSQTEKKIRWNK